MRLLALILFVSLAHAGEIKSFQLIDTGARQCDTLPQTITTNLTQAGLRDSIIYVKSVTVWIGARQGYRGDIAYKLDLAGVKFNQGWDHYAEPNSLSGSMHMFRFAPDYIVVHNYDEISFFFDCSKGWGGADYGPAHWQIVIFFTTEP